MSIEVDVERRLGNMAIRAQFASGAGVTALFGPSGAGKTSVINMVSGLLSPERGRIVVGGRVLFDAARGIDVPARKRRVGYVFQESRLFPHLNVRHNLLYGQRFTPVAARYTELDRVAGLLGIGHLLARRPALLSGGERQRVAIGRALLASPAVLLMDEPLASLDAPRKREILPYIERLRDELALPILYVSHQFEEVKRLANDLVVMDAGRITAAGPLQEVMARLELAPVGGREEVGAVIEARLARHDEALGLSYLDCAAGELVVPRVDQRAGTHVRVHVRAIDVILALERPRGLSVQNMLAATLVELREYTPPYVACRLDASGIPVIAYVTRKAARDLDLRPGCAVHALFKSVAVDGSRWGPQAAATRREPGPDGAAREP